MTMTNTELDGYKQQLLTLGERIRRETNELRDELPPRAADGEVGKAEPAEVPIDAVELGAHLNEEEVTISIVGNEEHLLAEVGAALARIENGAYGSCEGCRKAIARKRLRAVPFARCCVRCSREREKVAAR
jgi:DnaK suppressor protein